MSDLYLKKSQPVRLWISVPDESVKKSHQEWMRMIKKEREASKAPVIPGPALYLGDFK